MFRNFDFPNGPWRDFTSPGRPDRVRGDDGLVGVVGGLDLLQAAVGGEREHPAGRGRGFFGVVVVVADTPWGEGVLDRLRLRANGGGQVRCGADADGDQQVVRVDARLGAAAGGGAGQRATQMADLDTGQRRVGDGSATATRSRRPRSWTRSPRSVWCTRTWPVTLANIWLAIQGPACSEGPARRWFPLNRRARRAAALLQVVMAWRPAPGAWPRCP
jgi:hypothetical protein